MFHSQPTLYKSCWIVVTDDSYSLLHVVNSSLHGVCPFDGWSSGICK